MKMNIIKNNFIPIARYIYTIFIIEMNKINPLNTITEHELVLIASKVFPMLNFLGVSNMRNNNSILKITNKTKLLLKNKVTKMILRTIYCFSEFQNIVTI